jgi:lysophospholipase L1-like esterase
MAHRWQAHPRRRRASRSAWWVAATVIGALGILGAVALPRSVAVARSASSSGPGNSPSQSDGPPISTARPAWTWSSVARAHPRPASIVPDPPVTRPQVELPDVAPIAIARAGPGSTAVFLGDSFTSGWQGAGVGPHGWPQIVGRERGWRVVNLAVPGTGFLNPGWAGQPVGSLVGSAVARHPAVIVIAAGHNDSRWSPAATERAADLVIARLHRALPDAVLVVVGPIWQDGTPPLRCLALRGHLRRTAASIDAVFVDPIAERWFAGSRHRMIRADGIHPDDAGHRWIASRVLAAIARTGV